MSDVYNIKLQERFQDFLCLAKHEGSYFLYLKRCDSPIAFSDIKPVAYIETKPTETGNEMYVSSSWAISGFGNIMYAFVMMDLYAKNTYLCCDRNADLSDAAWDLWTSIEHNENYSSKNLKGKDLCPLYLESFADDSDISLNDLIMQIENGLSLEAIDCRNKCYTTSPDVGHSLAVMNNSAANLDETIVMEMIEDCVLMFDVLMYEEMTGEHAEKLKEYRFNNYADLDGFVNPPIAKKATNHNSMRP